jgi:ABC-type multidrug transport system fused ATPase/permease subunit
MISLNDLQKYTFIAITFILYIFSFHKNGMMRPLYSTSKYSLNKRLKQVGGNLKDNLNTVILAIISLFAIVSMYKYLNTVSIIFIFASIIMIFAITSNLLFAVALSMVLGSVIVSFTSTSGLERFENKNEEKKEKETDDKKKNEKKNEKKDETKDEVNMDDDIEPEKFEFDHKASFLENYKSLTKEQINGLNKDTVDLMQTQEKLIDTLKNMGPVLKDGKQVLDTFKSYFGDDMNTTDMGQMLNNVKNMKL